MLRSAVATALLVAAALTITACASETAGSAPHPPGVGALRTAHGWSTSAEGRLQFGCGLQLGLRRGDALLRHYLDLMSRELFISSVEATPTRAGAQLWTASDALRKREEAGAHQRLRRACREADMTAAVPDLGSLADYMCEIAGELRNKRPELSDFGPESTSGRPGDPLRHDPYFLTESLTLLSMKTATWEIPSADPLSAFGSGDNEQYRRALRAMAEICRR